MSHVLRLVLFSVLFAVLCITASELSSVGSGFLAKNIFAGFETASSAAHAPEPLRSRALEFRGLTPAPSESGLARLLTGQNTR
jgi:hypothetical protein